MLDARMDRQPFEPAAICPSCDGSGYLAAFGAWYACDDCGGAGYLVHAWPPTLEALAAILAAPFVRAMAEVDAVVGDADDRYRDEIEGR